MAALDPIFKTWETLPEMATDIGYPIDRVEKWRERSSIPPKYWPDLLTALRRKGKELSADDLLAMHVPKRRSRSRQSSDLCAS